MAAPAEIPITFTETILISVFPRRSRTETPAISSRCSLRYVRLSIIPIETKKKLVSRSRIGMIWPITS